MVLRYAHGKTDTRRVMVKLNDDLIGSLTFQPTADWSTWDSVSMNVSLKPGLNILHLKSLEEAGAPNLDQIGFDVAGVKLFEDSTQLSDIDTMTTEIPGTSSTANDYRGQYSAEDDFASNIRIASGVYLNFDDRTLITLKGGHVNIGFFDATGQSIVNFTSHVPAGSVNLDEIISKLPSGMYIVRVQLNGRIVQSGTQVKLEK